MDAGSQTPRDAVDVLVVGAGMAGLALARRLREDGASVVVLEARDRVGGRVRGSHPGSDEGVELGAQFVSAGQPRVTALIAELGLESRVLKRRGRSVHIDAAGHTSSAALGWLGRADAAMTLLRFAALARSTRARSDPRGDHVSVRSFLLRTARRDDARRYLEALLGAGFCLDVGQVSLRDALGELHSIGGLSKLAAADSRAIVGGSSRLTARLAAELGSAVVLDAEVTLIDQTGDDVVVGTRDGRRVTAGKVVMTVPPQLLPTIEILPTPPEPWTQRRREMLTGRITKTVAVFDRPWWRERGCNGSIGQEDSVYTEIVDASDSDALARGVLIGFSPGRHADDVAVLSEHHRRERFLSDVARAFGHPTPAPIGFMSADWTADPFSMGGYSSRPPLGSPPLDDLFAPLGRIHFAGTESAGSWRGYMEGALQSAERAAAEVSTGLRERM